MPSISLSTREDTVSFGYFLGSHLVAGSTILLNGDLGAGKTTLVQGMGQGLKIAEAIVSPTFTLINEYTSGRLPLYHLDLYRLEPQQVDSIYPEIYWEGVEVELGITAIEWSQRLTFLPQNYLEINLISIADDTREVSIKSFGNIVDSATLIQKFALQS